jgi:hypothetical protein
VRAARLVGGALAVSAARLAIPLAALCLALPALAGDVQRVEAVGAVGLDRDGTWTTPPRDAALRQALFEAVVGVARVEVPDLDAEQSEEALRAALGDDPFVYADRFRIVEDRGERPALLVQDGQVEREYVVVVEAYVDADRIRERLARAGLRAAPSGDAASSRFELVVLGLGSYGAYAAVRTALLEGGGAESATPLELSRERAVFEVVAPAEPRAFLEALVARNGPELEIVPIQAEGAGWVVRAVYRAPRPAPSPEAFDTPDRNRY